MHPTDNETGEKNNSGVISMRVIKIVYMSLLVPRDKAIAIICLILALTFFFLLAAFQRIPLFIGIVLSLTGFVLINVISSEKITVAVFNNDVPITKIYEDYEVIRVDYPYYYIRDGDD